MAVLLLFAAVVIPAEPRTQTRQSAARAGERSSLASRYALSTVRGPHARGKGIQTRGPLPWIPFPSLRSAGDDGRGSEARPRMASVGAARLGMTVEGQFDREVANDLPTS